MSKGIEQRGPLEWNVDTLKPTFPLHLLAMAFSSGRLAGLSQNRRLLSIVLMLFILVCPRHLPALNTSTFNLNVNIARIGIS